jgi:hypothetical protein
MSNASESANRPDARSQPPRRRGSLEEREQQLSDSEQLLEDRLSETQRRVKTVDLAQALTMLGVCSLLWGLLVVIADHWLLPGGLGPRLRLLFFLVLIAVWGALMIRRVLPLLLNRIHPLYAAQTMEEGVPTLKNGLISWWMLRRGEDRRRRLAPLEQHVLNGLSRSNADQIRTVPPELIVDRAILIRWAAVLTLLSGVLCFYAILSPKNPFVSIGRAAMPWASINRPSRVEISNVEPGDFDAKIGEMLTVKANVFGLRDDESPFVYFTTDDGRSIDSAIPMEIREGEPGFQCQLPPGRLGLQASLTYYVGAGDARSEIFRVSAKPVPNMVVEQLVYDYPDYTGLRNQDVDTTGDIRALEGTNVIIRARANVPITQAWAELDGDVMFPHRMTIEGQDAFTTLTLKMDPADPSQGWRESYSLRFVDKESGDAKASPIRHRIEVLPDLAPEIGWVEEPPEFAIVPLDGELRLRVRAQDPDYGLSRVGIRFEAADRVIEATPMFSGSTPDPFEDVFVFRPADYADLQPEDRLECWAEAIDIKTPEPNTASTERFWIVIDPSTTQGDQTAEGGSNNDDEGTEGGDSDTGDQGAEETPTDDPNADSDDTDDPGPEGDPGGGDETTPPKDSDPGGENTPTDPPEGEETTPENGTPNGTQDPPEQDPENGGAQDPPESPETGEENPTTPEDGMSSSEQDPAQPEDTESGGETDQNTGASDEESEHDPSEPGASEETPQSPEDTASEPPQGMGSEEADPSGSRTENDDTGSSQGTSTDEQITDNPAQSNQPNGGDDPGTDPNAPQTDNPNGGGASGEPNTNNSSDPNGQEGEADDNSSTPSSSSPTSEDPGDAQETGGEPQGQPEREGPVDGRTDPGEVFDEVLDRACEQGLCDSQGAPIDPNASSGGTADPNSAPGAYESTGQDPNTTPHEEAEGPLDDVRVNEGHGQDAGDAEADSHGTGPGSGAGTGEGTEPTDPETSGASGTENPGQEDFEQGNSVGGNPNPNGSESNEPGDLPSEGAEGGAGGEPNPNAPSDPSLDAPEGIPSGNAGNGGGSGGNSEGNSTGQQSSGDSLAEEEANREHAEQSVELALRYLEDQLDTEEVDQELLDRLGWSEADVERFVQEWRRMQADSRSFTPEEESEEENEWGEAIDALGLRPSGTRRQGGTNASDQIHAIESHRFDSPPSWQERFEAYTQGMASGNN